MQWGFNARMKTKKQYQVLFTNGELSIETLMDEVVVSFGDSSNIKKSHMQLKILEFCQSSVSLIERRCLGNTFR